jgi:hypothetical protein
MGVTAPEQKGDNPELAPIPYKDAPPSIKRQMEANAGLIPATDESPSETEQQIKTTGAMINIKASDRADVQGERDFNLRQQEMKKPELKKGKV